MGMKCLAQGHNNATPGKIGTRDPVIKEAQTLLPTELLGSQTKVFKSLTIFYDYTSLFCAGPGPEVIKLFFNLNSAEHEIYLAHKC